MLGLLVSLCYSMGELLANESYYRNPLWEPDLPDPSFIHAQDGWFYAYGTEQCWADGVRRSTPILRSKDMKKWVYIGDAFTWKPSWAPGDIWAVQCVYNHENNYYYLFYTVSDGNNLAIGVGRSPYPYGPFEDLGKVIDSIGQQVLVLDEFFTRVGPEGNMTNYLFFGSFHGIFGIQLASDWKTTVGEKFQIAGNSFEGSYIYHRQGKYYYFGSTGCCCCGDTSDYHLSVGAATDIRGPYLKRDGGDIMGGEGTLFLRGDEAIGWVGPGHKGEIIEDDAGRTYMIYHCIAKLNGNLPQPWGFTRRPLCMDEVLWDTDGWPYLEDGVPSITRKRAPFFKK
jgi:arabinan endo-1,5-alpha-L-arabinosidase